MHQQRSFKIVDQQPKKHLCNSIQVSTLVSLIFLRGRFQNILQKNTTFYLSTNQHKNMHCAYLFSYSYFISWFIIFLCHAIISKKLFILIEISSEFLKSLKSLACALCAHNLIAFSEYKLSLRHQFLNFNMHKNYLRSLLKCSGSVNGLYPRYSDFYACGQESSFQQIKLILMQVDWIKV